MSWPGLSIYGCLLQYSTPGSGLRAPLPSVGWRSLGRPHFGQRISRIVASGLPLTVTSPSSYIAASFSIRWGDCLGFEDDEGVVGGSENILAASCSISIAAVFALAIRSSRWTFRTMSWIML